MADGSWKERIGRIAGHPLLRGGLVITAGILIGNILGFARGAVTAYLVGTHTLADGLAVAVGPIDSLNAVLINTMTFAFVPLLARRHGRDRAKLLHRAARLLAGIFFSLTAAIVLFAPPLIRVLGPGLNPSTVPQAVNLLRIVSFSTLAAGTSGLMSALLYTERRFAPSAFHQAVLNLFVIVGAVLLWRRLGIYGFAIGYIAGAFTQLVLVSLFARRSWSRLMRIESGRPGEDHSTAELMAKPGSFLAYAGLLALNMVVTRAYATQAGPGIAAAFDYCIRCVNVLIAYLVSPISNSLLPEIARLRGDHRAGEAFRLIRRSLILTSVAAVAGCAVGLLVREPLIAILFQRGSFTAESTRMVSGVFLGFAPSLIGLSLIEITSRSLFALDRPWLPILAASVPVTLNLVVCALIHPRYPEQIGYGASFGLMAGFAVLFLALAASQNHSGSLER